MNGRDVHAVTGAYGYSGKYIAARLLEAGKRVITLTNSSERESPFGDQVEPFAYNFDRPGELRKSLKDVAVLYNTYWVRFNHRSFTHADAVRNSRVLFQAASDAGVQRIVHVSITNPSEDSELEYFRGKAQIERYLRESKIPYSILRPTVLFGKEDILINNIAWTLRHLPVFGIFGDGEYKLQPIYVDDLAELAVAQGMASGEAIIDAIGPETFTYRELVGMIGRQIGVRRRLVSVSPSIGYWTALIMGQLLDDVLVTREEIAGLMANLLCVSSPPAGTTKLTEWVTEHATSLGRRYTSELARRRDRLSTYQSN